MLKKISKRTVDALQPAQRALFAWDTELKGFGVKITPSGHKVYVVQYQAGGRGSKTRRVTLGRHGSPWTPDQARTEATKILSRVRLGEDPAEDRTRRRAEPTICELADRYISEHVRQHNKENTRKEIERIVETRIKPTLGRHRVSDLTRADIKAWHHSMRTTPYEANRALAYCSKMLSLAAFDWELRTENPCKGIQRFAETKRQRFLSDEELRRIGAALTGKMASGLASSSCRLVVQLLALTGLRLGEVLGMRWEFLDLPQRVLRLPDAKSGARTVPLGKEACALLSALQQTGPFVAAGTDASSPLNPYSFRNFWNRLRTVANVPDARPHDLRHTAGTYAAQAGFNAFQVRDLLGHKTMAMTGRYVERCVDPLRATADAVSGRVAAALASGMNTDEKGAMPFPIQKTG